ncbi:MAG TPA: glycoside hydrolase family 15 protein [Actinomycetes bacterium]|nr:glycoside hydrolase family 15 protein [Actinomycetes bacterium]
MTAPADEQSLELAVIGNGTVGALIDSKARFVWACLPHFAADPAFCTLLNPIAPEQGLCEVELEGLVRSRQRYLPNTAVLVTTLESEDGSSVEVTDFSPRFHRWDRLYHPVMFIRRIRPVSGAPRIRIRVRPLADWGARVPDRTSGSHHIRWVLTDTTLRLTTDARVPLVDRELPFVLDRPVALVLGPDETLNTSVESFAREAYDRTVDYWQEWTRSLSIPFEWQDAVIRAAITLKLCQYEGTGAIVAALTTSIPEAPESGRNWDYRYCWLRDAAFVVRALNQLGATKSMEEFLGYIYTLASGLGQMQPVYGIHFESALTEIEETQLQGFRGMGPVRSGNLAWQQQQHDVYGSVVLASTHLFFDQRLTTPGDATAFEQLERAGEVAYRVYDKPDAGLWEFRGRQGVHTYSSVMCWVAADRLSRIALQIGRTDQASLWRNRADQMRERILDEAYDAERGAIMETWGGARIDASTLVLSDLGFIAADDARFLGTLDAVEKQLKHGEYVFRYVDADDFGEPHTSFNLCTFWYIDALARVGRDEEARELFSNMLQRRNALGLMSEDLDPRSGEMWGNFPQTYSMVGIIQCAMRLSRPWETAS